MNMLIRSAWEAFKKKANTEAYGSIEACIRDFELFVSDWLQAQAPVGLQRIDAMDPTKPAGLAIATADGESYVLIEPAGAIAAGLSANRGPEMEPTVEIQMARNNNGSRTAPSESISTTGR